MEEASVRQKSFSYPAGLISFAVICAIAIALWYILMHPQGTLRLYTPMYGFSLVAVFLTCVVLVTRVMGYYPLNETAAPDGSPWLRGIGLTLFTFVLTLFVFYIVFRVFIGQLGVAYFSPTSIVASGGTGAEPFNAREISSTAIIYFATAFLWWALAWQIGFGRWPWSSSTPGVIAWSRLMTVLMLSTVTFAILYHPHVCYLFYPPQDKAGVAAWWSEFAGTGSAYFSLGLMLSATAWLVISDLLWEGRPWRSFAQIGKDGFWSGIAAILGSIILGLVSAAILLKIMTFFWMEPFEGGQYLDAPYFRYLHVGEISGFVILGAFILSVYFNNFPDFNSLPLRALVRTLIAFAIGGLLYWLYYSPVSTYLLGKVPGIAQPDDTPLVWTLLFLSVIMVHADFFERWPLNHKVPE